MGNYIMGKRVEIEGLEEYSEFMKNLLFSRGIKTTPEAQTFIHPDFESGTHDPFLLPDMEKSVQRILLAIRNGENIAIYSDYDADGIPGGALMYDFFSRIGYQNFINYIPHRHEEGYGLNIKAIEKIMGMGVTLMITVDCGITDIAQVEYANSLGMDIIITDHHIPGASLPPAFGVINPKREGSLYPYDMICGTGVAFKLVQAVLSKERFGLKEGSEKWLLDLVGIATISDMVPLCDENRVFAYYGLMVLRKTPRVGLLRLFRDLRINPRGINEDDVSFSITPRINAASRMDRPEEAFRLLVTKSEEEAGLLVKHLNKINDERKGVVAGISRELKKILKEREDVYVGRKILVIGNPNWKPALLGLVANGIKDSDGRAVFVWGRDGGKYIRGSCRSGGEVNLVELMEEAKDSFLEFGGHKMAGGFTVEEDKIHFLAETLEKAFEKLSLKETINRTETVVDDIITVGQVNERLWNDIVKLAPFGIGNPKPIFIIKDAVLIKVKSFGKVKNHLEIIVDNGGREMSAISFFKKPEDYFPEEKYPEKLDMVATIEKSSFAGRTTLRLRLEDIHKQ